MAAKFACDVIKRVNFWIFGNHLDVEMKMKFLPPIENMNRTKPLK